MAVLRKYYELAGFAVEGGNFSYVVTITTQARDTPGCG